MRAGHPVLFVGAGPGDPELITVAGQRALVSADLVVYAGSLVNPDLLENLPPHCRQEDSAGLDLDGIVDLLATGQRAGQRVVRLHSGDPSLYGAIAEQMRELRRRKVPFEVIPGVTAAFAAAAALGLEYTLPEITQSLVITRVAGRTPVPASEDLAGLASHGCSLAIYLSAGQADKVAAALSGAQGPSAPLAVVYRASWPDQQVLWTTPATLAADLAAAGIDRQALILAGPALAAAAAGQGQAGAQSRLYDPAFSHGHRRGKKET